MRFQVHPLTEKYDHGKLVCFEVQPFDQRFEDNEVDAGEADANANLGEHHRGVVMEHRDPVLRQELIQ